MVAGFHERLQIIIVGWFIKRKAFAKRKVALSAITNISFFMTVDRQITGLIISA